ncbi:hypothetical protein FH972_021839 [Carpinus fangiana]|uniref:Uncharacterized protein n=1 Tax=Carpinus fangiana TaxID=176857 RepID=A0A5N6KQV4_9ROSI|nr:hypothetical protein FH972_021839 [Carpinus fangiana]
MSRLCIGGNLAICRFGDIAHYSKSQQSNLGYTAPPSGLFRRYKRHNTTIEGEQHEQNQTEHGKCDASEAITSRRYLLQRTVHETGLGEGSLQFQLDMLAQEESASTKKSEYNIATVAVIHCSHTESGLLT